MEIILKMIEDNYFKNADEFKTNLHIKLTKKIGLAKAWEVVNKFNDIIEDKFTEIENERAERRAERRAEDAVMKRVQAFAEYKRQDREKVA